MDEAKSYIFTDPSGVQRIIGTRISLDSVVYGFQQGLSAEEIQRNFPGLTLEQVYGAIAHYLANGEQVDQYLQQQRAQWDRLRAEAERNPSAAVQRLRKLRANKAGLTP